MRARVPGNFRCWLIHAFQAWLGARRLPRYGPGVTRSTEGVRWVLAVPALAFLYILLRPVSNGQILLPALMTLPVLGTVSVLLTRRKLDPRWLVVIGAQVAFWALGTGVGAGNRATLSQTYIWLGVPIVFWLAVWGMTERGLRLALDILTIGTAILGTAIVLYVGSQQGVLPTVIPPSLLTESGAYFSGDYQTFSGSQTAIQLYGLVTLTATVPILVASLLIQRDHLSPRLWLRVYAAVFGVLAALVAGRRAVLVTAVLTPLLLIVVRWLISARQPRRAVAQGRRFVGVVTAFAMVAAVVVIGNLAFASQTVSGSVVSSSLNAVTSTFFGIGEVGGNISDVIRQQENQQLMQGWSTSPLWGHGFGAVLQSGFVRSVDEPWNFESQYHLLLFDTGIIGALLLLIAMSAVVMAIRAAVRARPDMAPTLIITTIGGLAMMLAAASNPFFQAPGYYWPMYLPLAAANIALTTPRSTVPPRISQLIRRSNRRQPDLLRTRPGQSLRRT